MHALVSATPQELVEEKDMCLSGTTEFQQGFDERGEKRRSMGAERPMVKYGSIWGEQLSSGASGPMLRRGDYRGNRIVMDR